MHGLCNQGTTLVVPQMPLTQPGLQPLRHHRPILPLSAWSLLCAAWGDCSRPWSFSWSHFWSHSWPRGYAAQFASDRRACPGGGRPAEETKNRGPIDTPGKNPLRNAHRGTGREGRPPGRLLAGTGRILHQGAADGNPLISGVRVLSTGRWREAARGSDRWPAARLNRLWKIRGKPGETAAAEAGRILLPVRHD